MKPASLPLADPAEIGALGVQQLKRFWSRVLRLRQGQPATAGAEAPVEYAVLDALGVGLEQTMQYLFHTGPSFAEFEQWIIATAGAVSAAQVARINALVTGADCPPETARWLAEVAAAKIEIRVDARQRRSKIRKNEPGAIAIIPEPHRAEKMDFDEYLFGFCHLILNATNHQYEEPNAIHHPTPDAGGLGPCYDRSLAGGGGSNHTFIRPRQWRDRSFSRHHVDADF